MTLQEILTALNKTLSDAEIGREIGAARSLVWRLRTGFHKNTFYERGVKIRKLAELHGVIDKE